MQRVLMIAALLLISTQSHAQSRCKVMDPTSTPLNVRTEPNGRVVETLPNGMLVAIVGSTRDRRGKAWVRVATFHEGIPLGWVFREFIACY